MKFPTGLSFQRLGSFPLDSSSVIGTRAQLEDYIANDPRSYAGQVVYVIEENEMFFLDANMEIKPISSEAGLNEEQLNVILDDKLNDRLNGYSLVKLTKEEYALLSEEEKNDESKLYIIIDTEEIDLSIFATKEELEQTAPLSHNHSTSEIEGLDDKFGNYDSTLLGIQEAIESKADSDHIHDIYANVDHNHDETYSLLDHDHNEVYSLLDHTHEGFATEDHNHENVYAEKIHRHMTDDITDLNQYLNNRKFSQSQITDLEATLQGKAEVGHTHNIAELDTWLNLSDYAMKADLDKKVDKVEGKGLSTNDFTNEEKEKLASIDLSKYATIEYVDEQINTHEHNLASEEDINTIINNLFN
jgi:hypothetical protein